MIRRISDLLTKVLKHREIWKGDTLYLRRFYLTPRKWPIRLFLHFIFRSDDDPDCHDHPWDFASLILWNGYLEESLPRTSDIGDPIYKAMPHWNYFLAPSFRVMKAEHIHKVHLDNKKPAVTLVFAKKARRNWGFWKQDIRDGRKKWIDWRTYLGLPQSFEDHLEDVID